MATAERKLALLSWSPEGRTLGEFVKDLVGPVAWPLLLQMTGEGERPSRFNGVNRIYLVSDPARSLGIATDNSRPYIAAVKACLPLLDLWNSELVAYGRRDDELAPATEVRPPTNWQVVILSLIHSTIMVHDPGKWNGPKIYDLRFSLRASEELSGAAVWAVPEAKRLKAAGKIFKTKTAFAKEIVKAPVNAESAKPVAHLHISNHLVAWHLWPIDSIK